MTPAYEKLSCGTELFVEEVNDASIVVRLTDPNHVASWVGTPAIGDTPHMLNIYMFRSNLPVIKKMVDAMLPKPTFFDKLKNLFSGE